MNRPAYRRSCAAIATLALGAASADPADVEVPEPFEACLSCHAFLQDEPHQEGPTLWQVVGRRIAGADGFDYSDALRSHQGHWDRDKLDRFLAAPQAFAPGTRMTVGGVRSAADRKEVLDFLETLGVAAAALAPASDAAVDGKGGE